MAGDWIPIDTTLWTKPEVMHIRALTGATLPEVIGALVMFWAWADAHSEDGFLPVTDVTTLCDICHRLDGQFCDAMQTVGWLTVDERGIRIPNFDNWMGRSAKKRLKDARRQQKSRSNRNSPTQTDGQMPQGVVTDVTSGCDKFVTRVEESRGEYSTTPSELFPGHVFDRPGRHNLLTFPIDGKPPKGSKEKAWHLTQDLADELKELFPSLDILAQARAALAWVKADPGRKKTARGMRTFLTGWLTKAQNRGEGRKVVGTPPPEEIASPVASQAPSQPRELTAEERKAAVEALRAGRQAREASREDG